MMNLNPKGLTGRGLSSRRLSGREVSNRRLSNKALDNGTIDFTRLAISTDCKEATPFSFFVIGDTDAGQQKSGLPNHFSEVLAAKLLQQVGSVEENSDLLLHTGDVTYPVGSYQNYLEGFLRPYCSLLSKIPTAPRYDSCDVVFNRPLLSVPGNHDYATMPRHRLLHRAIRHICDAFRHLGLDFGYYGGENGEAYETTFLDKLHRLSDEQIKQHLAHHYTASIKDHFVDKSTSQYCLSYRPSQFTRLPNRYYRFRYGGVDFFALDSNTWNMSADAEGFDHEQLDWLEKSLITSWQADLDSHDEASNTVARIIYLHHSPYTTEESRWQQSETLWVRRHLRAVLDRVAQTLDRDVRDYLEHKQPPFVDLVLSGHAHCFEHLKTGDTGHADSYIDWIVCGGSGAVTRRQRQTGKDILESISEQGHSRTSVVAKSCLYAGVHGRGRKRQQFHSFVEVKIQPQQQNKIVINPFVLDQRYGNWQTTALNPIPLVPQQHHSEVTIPSRRVAS